MNLSLIADFADVLAALGIIASLAFVALQVKQNTHQLKNTHLENVIDRYNTFYSRAYNQETAAVVLKGQQRYEHLDDVERLTFATWMREFISSYAATHILAGQGILRSDVRDAHDQRVRWMFRHQGAREWWRAADRVPFPADIVARIDELIDRL